MCKWSKSLNTGRGGFFLWIRKVKKQMLISKSYHLLLIQCHLQKYSPLLHVLCFPCKYHCWTNRIPWTFWFHSSCAKYTTFHLFCCQFERISNKDIHNFKQNWCFKMNKKKHPFPKPPWNTETQQIGVSWYDARGKLCFVCWEQASEHVKRQGCVERCLIVLSLQLVTDRVILIKSATVLRCWWQLNH